MATSSNQPRLIRTSHAWPCGKRTHPTLDRELKAARQGASEDETEERFQALRAYIRERYREEDKRKARGAAGA
jgi:hypothetical protein